MKFLKTKNSKKINLAIIGIGHLGAKHLKVLSKLRDKVNLVGVCDINRDRTERLARHYRARYFGDYRDLLGQVDAVDICVPTHSHFEIGRFFLNNGVHTFVEKPITHTLEEADALIALAQENNLKLQVGHIERFNSAFQGIKVFAKDPLFIESHRLNLFPNRSLDIGVVMDLMIHDIDIILGLVKAPIKDIQAVGANVLTPLEDIANVRLTFENGCVCNLTASRISDEVVRKIRIFLKETYISLDYVKQSAFIYKKHGKQILKHRLPIEREEPLKKELEAFIDCIINDQEPYVTGQDGREALKVALEISRKIWEPQASILL